MFKIEYERQVLKSLEKIPKKDQVAILTKIEGLAIDPRPQGSLNMKGNFSGYQRIRVGNYRIIYTIEDQALLILVVKIGHRRDIYL